MSLEYIAALNKKDYQDEAKYEDYEKKAIKRAPLQIDFKIPKTKGNSDKMTNRDDVARLEARDNAIEAEMERLTNLAIPDMPNKFKPIVNEVTPEMIADYQEEQRKPLEIDGKFFAYHPVDLEIDTEYIPSLKTKFTEQDLKDITTTEVEGLDRLAELEDVVRQIDLYIARSKDELDEALAAIYQDYRDGEIGSRESFDIQQAEREAYARDISRANKRREQIVSIIDNITGELERIGTANEQAVEEFTQNKAEIARVKQENAKKLRDAEQTFSLLNQGRASISQMPGETDEDYAVRLREAAANPPEIDPETLAERVVMRETEKLIANLKTILKPEQASNIAKMLNPEEKHTINKFFPKIKKAYEKTYSKTVKVAERELIDFFLQQTGYEEKPLAGTSEFIPVAEEVQPPIQRRARPPRAPRESSDIAAARELTRQYRAAEAEGEFPVAEGRIIAPKASSFKNRDEIKAYLARYHPDDPRFKGLKPQASKPEVIQAYKEIVGEVEPTFRPLEFPLAKRGEGIHSKSLPKRAHFGKVSINPHNLYHKNLLQVRNLKGQAIGVSDIKVSDGMSEMLLKMLEGVNPTKKDFAILEKHEPSLYNNLIHLAQLHKNYETPNLQETKQQMKHRMELLQGEIEAGNTAPSILSEAKQLLRLMVGNGMLKSPAARKHYEYLKNYNK
jgi:hypothetical protein